MTATLGPKHPWDQKRLEALVLDLTPLFKDLIELDNVLQDIDYERYLCDHDTMPHAAKLLRDKWKTKNGEHITALLRITDLLGQLMEQKQQEQEQVQEQKQQESDDDY